MGTVYRADGPHGPVAVKVLHRHLLQAPGAFKRFLREAEIGRRVRHPNVVRTLEVDAADLGGETVHYLVMDYVEGQTLRQLLDELGTVPEELCRHITASIADALEAIHGLGAIHRDLKPENVLVTPDHTVQVMDLGVAFLADEAMRLSQTGHFLGSVLYAAPEQWEMSPEFDARCDLFSVGVMLYELATGRHPFRGKKQLGPPNLAGVEPAGRVNPQLSPFFEELTNCLMSARPDGRLGSATELGIVVREAESSAWWLSRATQLRLEAKRPLRRIRIPRETPLFGRDDDLAALRTAYDSAKNGDGRVLLIEGEAGIGKSRLVDEFVGLLEAEGEDVAFLYGSYPPGGAATVAGAFSTAYREYFGAESLPETLARHLPKTPGLVPAFAALLRGEAPPEGSAPLGKSSLQTVFVEATRSIAESRPVVVLIDDLHFAPTEGLALFLALSLSVPGHRVLLLGTARDGQLEEWSAALERPGHVDRRMLHRLGPRDLTMLLADAFGSESLARSLAFQISAKSDGNPFFIFEILQELRRQGSIKEAGGRWSTTETIEKIGVPSSVIDLVQARLASLDTEDRELLDIAACIGFEFDPALVAEAAGAPLLGALKRFAQVERAHRVIRANGRTYQFDHHQFQETLHDRLFVQLREQYHVAIAAALENREPKPAIEISDHYLRGGTGERAEPYVRDAVEELAAGQLYGAAADMADRVLSIPGLIEGRDRIHLLQHASTWFERSGRSDQDRRCTNEAHALALELGDEKLIARTTRSQAINRARDGDYQGAVELAAEAKRIAKRSGNMRAYADSCTTGGNALIWLGRTREALAQYEEAYATDVESGKPEYQLISLGNMGRTVGRLGDLEKGLELQREALEIAREHNVTWAQATLSSNIGADEHSQGRFARALAHLEESLSLNQQLGDRYSEAIALTNVGSVQLYLGNEDPARDCLQRAVDLSSEIGNDRVRSYAVLNLSRLCAQCGEREAAVAHAEEGLRLRRELNYGSGLADAYLHLARVTEDPEPALEQAWEHARERDQRNHLWMVQALRAKHGLAPRGEKVGPDAANVLEQLEGSWAFAEGTGDPEWRERARTLMQSILDEAPPEYRDSMVENVPLYRAILS
jgi:tetratricopeptide (TPR) repeat protein